MGIIDDKGRLFGRINIVDLFILGAILFSAYFAFRWATIAEDPDWVKFATRNVKIECRVTMAVEIADKVKEGDLFINDNGKVMGNVYKVVEKKPVNPVIYKSRDGEKLFFTNSNDMNIILIVELLVFEKKGHLYHYSDAITPMSNGSAMALKTKEYTLSILIVKILG